MLFCMFLGLNSFSSVELDNDNIETVDCQAVAARAWRVAITLTNGDYDAAYDYHFYAYKKCVNENL